MSDIAIPFPLWLGVVFFGFEAWPVVLAAAFFSVGLAFFARGVLRWLLVCLAALLMAECAGGAVFWHGRAQQEAASELASQQSHSTLQASVEIDGLLLPAGTEVSWIDGTRSHVWKAFLPRPTPLLGTVLDGWLQNEHGQWLCQVPADTVVNGWPCTAGAVRLSGTGRLESCTLAANRAWMGRLVPRGSLIGYVGGLEDGVPVGLPEGAQMDFPENGVSLTGVQSLTLNSNGSLRQTFFKFSDALVADGAALWNLVSWTYHDGGGAVPSAITGTLAHDLDRDGEHLDAGTTVTVALPSGTITVHR